MKPIIAPIEHFECESAHFRPVTIIDAYDSFTHNLVHCFLQLGASVTVLRSKEITLVDVDRELGNYLVLSPGPGTPSSAGLYKTIIENYWQQISTLGVCLGMQAINEIFGGITIPAPIPMHGKISIIHHDGTGIFSDVPNPTPVARYHSLCCSQISHWLQLQSTFETVPMAFHIPNQIAAVQFHPESFLTQDGLLMLRNFLEHRL